MAACRSSSKNTWKLNLQPILNKNSPWIQTELELDMFDVARKLVQKKNWKINKFVSQAAQTTNNQFSVSRNFRD
jgi:hypothetical protein